MIDILGFLQKCYNFLSGLSIPTPFGSVSLWAILIADVVVGGIFAIVYHFIGGD